MGRLKVVFKILLFLVIFVFIFKEVAYIFRHKDGAWCVEPIYYEDKLDVIFLGPSTTDVGIRPMQLWDKYGITSFNTGYPNNTVIMNYYNIEEYIKRFCPKVIMIDCIRINRNWANNAEKHDVMDKMKLSLTKLKLVNEVIPKYERLEFLFPLISFHTNWKTLTEGDFEKIKRSYDKSTTYVIEAPEDESMLKRLYNNGDFVITKKGVYENKKNISQTLEESKLGELNKVYIDKVIKICDENDIKLIFFATPTVLKEKKMDFNALKSFIVNKKAECIDFYELVDELKFDSNEDLIDQQHPSESGAIKLTEYIGKYLMEKGYVEDRRNDPEFAEWHEDYQNSIYKQLYLK